MVKQISIFLENQQGKLYTATKTLADAQVNLRALSLADVTDFGVLRLIVDKPETALQALREAGFTVKISEVIAVEVRDVPGGMAETMTVIDECGADLGYLYAFLGRKSEKAIIIFQVEDAANIYQQLQQKGVHLVDAEELYHL